MDGQATGLVDAQRTGAAGGFFAERRDSQPQQARYPVVPADSVGVCGEVRTGFLGGP